jgi:nitrate reductase delta subunit
MTTMTFKALGALLMYPEPLLLDALPEIVETIEGERLLDEPTLDGLRRLSVTLTAAEPLEAEERYVALFDRGRQTSLHLFEHVHGESRDRGQAMIDLQEVYRKHGLLLAEHELPDYLPAVLEYLSQIPLDEARTMLGECRHILHALQERLSTLDSDYAAVLTALLEIAGDVDADSDALPAHAQLDLDEAWDEEPVVFGPAAACSARAANQPSVVRFVQKQQLGKELP